MINFLKKHKLIIFLSIIPYIALILFLTLPTKYVCYIPGSVDKISDTIKINDKSVDNYYTTSVYYESDISLFKKIYFNSRKDCLIYKKTVSDSTNSLQGEIEHNGALSSSIICGYNKASADLKYAFKGIYVYDNANSNLLIGDVILGETKNDVIDNFNNEETKILRNNKELNIKVTNKENVKLEYDYYEIYNEEIEVLFDNSEGPSGGFMQALMIYDTLVDDNLSKDLKIAGTGTIDEYGDVGAIGCIGIKIYTAIYNNCDIFFAPIENKDEALLTYNRLDTDMDLVFVDNIDEAIKYLEERNA